MKTSKNTKKLKIFLLFLLGFFLVIFFVIILSPFERRSGDGELPEKINRVSQEKVEEELIISEKNVFLGVGSEPVQLSVTLGDEDITKEAFWFSDDGSVATVGNDPETKGRVVAAGEGKTIVGASYNDQFAEAIVETKNPELNIVCSPSSSEISVGEEVQFIGIFNDVGVPNYTYIWSGDDGMEGSMGVVSWTYETPGIKNVNFKAIDQVGATAEASCFVTVVSDTPEN